VTADLRLVIFDVDGTLVDSQAVIVAAMTHAFEAQNIPVLDQKDVLGIVGLSLPQAIAQLVPDLSQDVQRKLVEGYKDAFVSLRSNKGDLSSPLYPGAGDVLDHLQGQETTLLGVATGKSKRGLDIMIASHNLQGLFLTQQVADFHPSKPHPAMVLTAMAEMGVEPHQTVMIGDTTFDIEMGRAAGARTIGVDWGYHDTDHLREVGADCIATQFDQIPRLIDQILE